MLDTQDLSVGYDGVDVVREANFYAPASSLTALIGANGAGKSTLLRAIAGLSPATGHVLLGGASANRREDIAYMPQDTSAASGLTLLETVMLGRLSSLGWSTPAAVVDAASDLLAQFGLSALADRPLHAVSGGQRQLAFLAQALVRAPQALLLDEPTAALDLRHQLLVLEAVKADAGRRRIPVIAAMHDLSLVGRFADHVICLQAGLVVATGAPAVVLTADRIAAIYGVSAEVEVRAGRPRIELLSAIN
ncbi:MAG: ABC transporter ATP-binding protein [Pseudomonadota bacterium]